MSGTTGRNRYASLKRALDVAAAGAGLVLASPVLAGVAVVVAAKHGRPVLFSQERPGKNGEIFKLYKFRSMLPVDATRDQISDEQRLTPFGRWLRSTSLDELPSLWNVLRGDMSFVGPRPLLVQYLERYSPRQARRHNVRPGITGLAQVSGRNDLNWERRFELDVAYVDGVSLKLDALILWRTVTTVIRRQGVNQQGRATMDEFQGDAQRSNPGDGTAP